MILQYFKTSHTKVTMFGCNEKAYSYRAYMKSSISEATVRDNFLLRFTLICLIFLNWVLRNEIFSPFTLCL